MQPKPYLRDDLEITESGTPRTRSFIEDTWQNLDGSPRRLLATVDYLYAALDDETKRVASKSAAITELHKRITEQQREMGSLKRTSFLHSELPTGVRDLREEAAAWKDQYAVLKSLYDQRGRVLDQTSEQWKAMKASRKKWRRRARRAEAIGVIQVERINELQQQHAQDIGELVRTSEKLEAQLCLEAKDHRHTIEFAARAYETWCQQKWGPGRGNLVAEWFATGGVESVHQLKKAAGL